MLSPSNPQKTLKNTLFTRKRNPSKRSIDLSHKKIKKMDHIS